jgi:hypothetical protein
MSVPSRLSALVLMLFVLALGPVVANAQPASKAGPTQPQTTAPESPAQTEDVTVRSPDSPPPPPPQTGILELAYPELRDDMSRMDPFFRDTDLNVRLRTFYFNRQNDNDTANEAWAGGGWVQYASGWLLDTFAIGSTYYTSLPLYTPDGREGTLLLTPDHDAIGVFGEAWGALRYRELALLKGYRQRIDDGYVNSQDNRMVPNTFEAVTLSGILDRVRYNVGYLWNIKPRDSNDFISMSQQAGAPGGDEGLILTSLAFTPTKDLLIYVGNYHAQEVFNTTFAKGEYTHAFNKELKAQFGLQFTDQRDVGDQRLGEFNTWNVGAGARVLFKGLSVGAATHFTGDEASIRSPWGSWPGYLSLMVTDFDRANEKAFGVGVKYDFGGTLLPLSVPGLTVHLLYGQGRDREDPATGSGLPTTHEGNLDIIYNVAAVKGLSLRFRNAYVGRGDASVLQDYRLIINYELDML